MEKQAKIKVGVLIDAPVEKVWKMWNTPEDIMNWNSADPGWHCPSSHNDLRVGGTFNNRMEARDGSFGFDFAGIYDKVDLHKEIAYTMADGRTVSTVFEEQNGKTAVLTALDPENENDPEFQKQGWQAILDNFVKYAESANA